MSEFSHVLGSNPQTGAVPQVVVDWLAENLPDSGTSVTRLRESVASSAALPTQGNSPGDARITQDTGHFWVWDGTAWVDAGPVAEGPPGDHKHAGADITSGTISSARLGSGTANSTTILYGDGTWKTAPTGGSGTPADATATTKGVVQLAGDLAGSAAAPTVPGLAGKANASHQHNASDVNAGTLAIARIPTGTTSSTVALGNHTHDDRYYTEAEVNTALAGKAAATHSHPVSQITATGTPSATTYLRGDGAWATPAGGGGNTHTSADATRPALPAGTVWLSTAATRPATMQTGDIWIGEPL